MKSLQSFHIQMNPILKKELRSDARTFRFPLALTLYSAFLSAIVLFIFWIQNSRSFFGSNAASVLSIYPNSYVWLSFFQLAMICLIMPSLTANSISGEREKQTLDIMLTTPMSLFRITLGKVWTAMIKLMMYLICSIPAMSLCFIYGGLKWQNLITFLICALALAFFIGSLGVYASARFRRSVTATVMTIIFEGGLFGISPLIVIGVYLSKYLPYLQTGAYPSSADMKMGLWPLLLLANPVLGVCHIMANNCFGFDLARFAAAEGLSQYTSAGIVSAISPYWGILSLLLTVGMGIGFLYQASRILDGSRIRNKKLGIKAKSNESDR